MGKHDSGARQIDAQAKTEVLRAVPDSEMQPLERMGDDEMQRIQAEWQDFRDENPHLLRKIPGGYELPMPPKESKLGKEIARYSTERKLRDQDARDARQEAHQQKLRGEREAKQVQETALSELLESLNQKNGDQQSVVDAIAQIEPHLENLTDDQMDVLADSWMRNVVDGALVVGNDGRKIVERLTDHANMLQEEARRKKERERQNVRFFSAEEMRQFREYEENAVDEELAEQSAQTARPARPGEVQAIPMADIRAYKKTMEAEADEELAEAAERKKEEEAAKKKGGIIGFFKGLFGGK
jgi:hypothetical protein